MATATATRPASLKQVEFLWKLVAEKGALPWMDADGEWAADLSLNEASNAIGELMAQPRKPAVHQDGQALGEGYYWVNGLAYKVQKSQTGNFYAKVFSESGYEYAPGAMRVLASAERLTLEQAAELGIKTGRCVACGKLLTDPESVAYGVGPVCRAKF
jgi:hypothetical protein